MRRPAIQISQTSGIAIPSGGTWLSGLTSSVSSRSVDGWTPAFVKVKSIRTLGNIFFFWYYGYKLWWFGINLCFGCFERMVCKVAGKVFPFDLWTHGLRDGRWREYLTYYFFNHPLYLCYVNARLLVQVYLLMHPSKPNLVSPLTSLDGQYCL